MAQPASSRGSTAETLQPQLITFSDGVAVNSHLEVKEETTMEKVDWEKGLFFNDLVVEQAYGTLCLTCRAILRNSVCGKY